MVKLGVAAQDLLTLSELGFHVFVQLLNVNWALMCFGFQKKMEAFEQQTILLIIHLSSFKYSSFHNHAEV